MCQRIVQIKGELWAGRLWFAILNNYLIKGEQFEQRFKRDEETSPKDICWENAKDKRQEWAGGIANKLVPPKSHWVATVGKTFQRWPELVTWSLYFLCWGRWETFESFEQRKDMIWIAF